MIIMMMMMIILQPMTYEEDEQQQGTVNGPPQLESSVVMTDFNMPNTEAVG